MAFEPKLTADQWEEIKVKYEAGIPISAIGKEYDVSRTAIVKKATKKGWIKGSTTATADGVTDDTLNHETLKGALAERTKLIKKHRKEWLALERIDEEIESCLYDPKYKPAFWEDWVVIDWDTSVTPPKPLKQRFNPFDGTARERHAKYLQGLYRQKAEGLMTKQEGQRRAFGFDYKMQQEDANKDDKALEERRKLAHELMDRATRFARKALPAPVPADAKGDLPA